MGKGWLFPPRIRVENKIKMPKTSSNTLASRAVISLSSGQIYEDGIELEMDVAVEG